MMNTTYTTDTADRGYFPFRELIPTEGTADSGSSESDAGRYKNSTYEIVSLVAYLIGVPERIFANEHEPPRPDVYERLEKEKPARIIRHLCIIRTAIEQNYKKINEKMRFENISIFNQPDYVPPESLLQLEQDGIRFSARRCTKPSDYIIEINGQISNRINNCMGLFPDWLNWQYIRSLFITPDGTTEEGTKVAADRYYAGKSLYPYQVYMNWEPRDVGNILYNDKKFVSCLYQWNDDLFTDLNKVSDVAGYVKSNIYEFLDQSEKIVMVVDCENSDPYRLFAAIRNLDREYTEKISLIILFDDEHTGTAWEILEKYTDIPVEYLLVDRLKQDKSLVDAKLITRTCREHYQNHVDSFVLVSSDSDYWAMVSSMEDARFIVMVEHEKCGVDLKRALMEAGIFYCFLDDFYSGNADDIKRGALIREMNGYVAENMNININEMFDAALLATRIRMSEDQKKRFMAQYVRTMAMRIAENGDVVLEFKR